MAFVVAHRFINFLSYCVSSVVASNPVGCNILIPDVGTASGKVGIKEPGTSGPFVPISSPAVLN